MTPTAACSTTSPLTAGFSSIHWSATVRSLRSRSCRTGGRAAEAPVPMSFLQCAQHARIVVRPERSVRVGDDPRPSRRRTGDLAEIALVAREDDPDGRPHGFRGPLGRHVLVLPGVTEKTLILGDPREHGPKVEEPV